MPRKDRRGSAWPSGETSRPRGAFVVAIVLHVVAGVVIAGLTVTLPSRSRPSPQLAPEEHVSFVDVQAATAPNRPRSRRPTNSPRRGRSERSTGPGATAPVAPSRADSGGLTYRTGSGGRADPRAAAAGVEPRLADPRVWTPAGPSQKTATDRLDSAVTSWVARANDSVAALTRGARRPGDWTVEKGGRKYGIDSQYIHLGKVSIPTAVLALLPLNVQANPTLAGEWKANAYMRSDIMYHAQRAVGDSILKAAAARVRARKERERQEGRAPTIVATPTSEPQASP